MATALLEVTLSWLLANAKGRDARSFYTRAAFAEHAGQQTVAVASPECGPSGARLDAVKHLAGGGGNFPALEWSAPPELATAVREWLLVCEDVDVPLPAPVTHGIYIGIPASKTSINAADFEITDAGAASLQGGFHYGKTLRGVPYVPPRPLMNHGPHRYFFQVVALSEPLDHKLLRSKPTKDQIADAIVGKVLGWGMWVGVAERKWE